MCPSGIVRWISVFGGLYEGNMDSNFNRNGWGIYYYISGRPQDDEIWIGWWRDNYLYGNCYTINLNNNQINK